MNSSPQMSSKGRTLSGWARFNKWLSSVPDCPSCKGTGEPSQLDDIVYWKGEQVVVCFQCKGSGKV